MKNEKNHLSRLDGVDNKTDINSYVYALEKLQVDAKFSWIYVGIIQKYKILT